MLQNQKLVAFGQRQANLEHSHSCKEEEEDDLFAPHSPAIIFDALKLDEEVPSGFNAVRIPLDATLKSDLNWKLERTAAEKYIHQGFRIFWDIQLGIGRPNGLAFPLTNHSQFLSLSISLEHFRDTIWKDFREKTVGLCLYRGSADFSSGFLWNEEELGNFRSWLKEIFEDVSTFTSETLSIVSSFEEINPQNLAASVEGDRLLAIYCRNITGRYLGTLSDCVPDTLQCYVLLDIQNILDPLLQVQLTAKESFSRINLGIRGPLFYNDVLSWEGFPGEQGLISRKLIANSENLNVRTGVCIPSTLQNLPSKWKSLKDAFSDLKEKNIPFRAIPEVSLTNDWDGLDFLIASPQNLSTQGCRKLQGFKAAGGIVVSVD